MGFAVTCWRCQLQAQLTDLLANPDGVILSVLQPFVDALLGLPQPRIAYVWIRRNTAVQTTLRRLATGEAPLDHATFDQLPGRTTEYLRGLLVEHGCLPGRDRYLAAFEAWLPTKLDQISDPSARRHVDAFARWHLLRQLRDRAKREPIPAGAFLNAKQSTTVAIDFLDWLAGRGRQLETVTQADVDAWYSSGPSTRQHASRFLSWAREQHLIRTDPLRLKHDGGPIMSEGERLDQLNRLLHDRSLPVTPRLIGLLVLMFAQPLSRIVRLPRQAVAVADGQTSLWLGRHALDLPPEVEAVVHDHLAHIADHRNEAGHFEQRWLFPGLQPGQPLHVFSAAGMLKKIGLPARAARNTAWQQMVQQAPAAILATDSAPNAAPPPVTPSSPAPTTPATPAPPVATSRRQSSHRKGTLLRELRGRTCRLLRTAGWPWVTGTRARSGHAGVSDCSNTVTSSSRPWPGAARSGRATRAISPRVSGSGWIRTEP